MYVRNPAAEGDWLEKSHCEETSSADTINAAITGDIVSVGAADGEHKAGNPWGDGGGCVCVCVCVCARANN